MLRGNRGQSVTQLAPEFFVTGTTSSRLLPSVAESVAEKSVCRAVWFLTARSRKALDSLGE